MRFFRFLTSMKFGLIILLTICLVSLIGTLIPQGQEITYYLTNYKYGNFILKTGINRVYNQWYFFILPVLLLINLVFCSILRVGRIHKLRENRFKLLGNEHVSEISETQKTDLESFLQNSRFKCKKENEVLIYYKNLMGYYGSFVTHLGILFVICIASLVTYTAKTKDIVLQIGIPFALENQTIVTAQSFQVTDNTGRLDYISKLFFEGPNNNFKEAQISVNHPISFNGDIYYQKSYITIGTLLIKNRTTGVTDRIQLDRSMFLESGDSEGIIFLEASINQEHGLVYDYIKKIDGKFYPSIATPGTVCEIGEYQFVFGFPSYQPKILIKTVSRLLFGLLYCSFIVLIVGLWLCFFHVPVFVFVCNRTYEIKCPKEPLSLQMKIDLLLLKEEVK